MANKVRVAIIGLGFGAEFIPIYQNHPDAEMYAICRRNKEEMDKVGDRFKIAKRYTDFKDVLKDPNVDAVHINSPIADHAPQSIAALKAGKHVACTVPMGTSIDECRQIVDLQRKTGKVYMMMETVVYAREYLFVKELYDKGELGRIQFLRGSHQQDMEGWPGYWPGLPPMWYATHCVGAVPGDPEQAGQAGAGRERRLPRLRADPRRADREVQQPVRDRDGDVQDRRQRRGRRGDAQPVRRRPAVPRELRRVREQEELRVAAGGERGAGHPPQGDPGAGDPGADEGAGLRAAACPSRSAGSRSPRRSRTPTTSASSRAAATAGATRTWCTTSSWPCSASSRRSPTRRPAPTGRWSASAPTSRP